MRVDLNKVAKYTKMLGITGYNRKKNVFGINPLLVSTAFMLITAVLASGLRKATKRLTGEGFVRLLLLEFIATAELCGTCYELIIVADNYGIWMYALYLFLLTIWWSRVWDTANACPYIHMEDVLEGSQPWKYAGLLILSQILGGAVIYSYVEALWSLELVETHRGKVDEDCSGDLQVTMFFGAAIECIATCLCRITSKFLSATSSRFATVVDSFFATMMVVAAANYTGGYFNPALASSLKFGCDGHTFVEHMVVYWIGASSGAALNYYIYSTSFMQNIVGKLKVKEE